jgi:mannose-1-phosphate guanylyltransferase
MDRPIVAVILAGGTGTRLYPATRPDRPKQFLTFGGDRSLLTNTVERAGFADEVVVSTRPAFAAAVPEHVPDAEVVVEPAPRDTGPAIVYAAHRLAGRDDEPVMLVLPSDHVVGDGFEPVARRAVEVAVETSRLVTIGVDPDRPATGYGYIEPGREHENWTEVERFHEKPDRADAERFIQQGWYWNAGIFAWTPGALLKAARTTSLEPLVESLEAGSVERGFETVEAASIDRAVLEQADSVAVVPAAFEWDDLGSWDAIGRVIDEPLAETLELEGSGNVIATDGTHVTTIGVDDLVIAAYDDRVLVVPRQHAERVRAAVERLRADGKY